MSPFGIGKTCVFSPVKAKITQNGQPLVKAKIIRRWEWNSSQEDSTLTDANGAFELPAVYEKSVSRLLPVELVVAQALYVVVGTEEKKIWSNSKRDAAENAEFGGKPFVLSCELTNEMRIHRDFGSIMNTLCTWEIN